jgi:hypothetical protein
MFSTTYKYGDKSKLEYRHWNSPGVDSCVVGVGWALPTLPDETAMFGGHSPPYDKKFMQR